MTKLLPSRLKSSPHPKNLFLIVLLFALPPLLVIIGIGWWRLETNNLHISTQKEMQSYVEEKYGKKFHVGEVRRQANGLGVQGYLMSDSYALDNPQLGFKITKVEGSKPSDSYLSARWTAEESERIKIFLQSIYESIPDYSVLVSAPDINYLTRLPTFDEGRSVAPSDIFYFVEVSVHDETHPSPDSYHYEKILAIIRYIRDKSPERPEIRYEIRSSQSKAYYNCNLTKNNLLQIQSTDDLVSCFKNIKENREK